MFYSYYPYFYYACFTVCAFYALLRGGKTEAWGVAIIAIGSLGTTFAIIILGPTWAEFNYVMFGIDLAAFVALAFVALTSDRFWPMWATAFHFLTLAVHLATYLAPTIMPWAFATGAAFWAYPMLLMLGIGARENIRSEQSAI